MFALLVIFANSVFVVGVYEEVCMWRKFEADCSEDEVLVVEKAIYGQGPNSSRCANGATDAQNCSFDVQMYFDRKCGGRQTCKVEIPNKDLSELKGLSCKSQQNLYLAISYNCEYVYSAHGQTCASNQSITVSVAEGHLSSIVAAETNKGSSVCPWRIQLDHSQSVRFTMLDFGLQQTNIVPDQRGVCRIYAKFVLHHDSGETTRSVECGGDKRQKTLAFYLSSAQEVDIILRTNPGSKEEDFISFLIKFEVFSRCPEFIPSANTSVTKTRFGLRVTCLRNAEINWTLHCIDGRWMPDTYRSCDDFLRHNTIIDSTSSSFDRVDIYPIWLLTSLPAAGGVLFLGILVPVGFCWRIRKQSRQAEHTNSGGSSAHHYSDVDINQITPEMITDTILEDPDTTVDQTDLTTLMPYSDLNHALAAPIVAVYSGLQNENLIMEDIGHRGTNDSSSTRPSVTPPPYANVVPQ